MGVQQRASDLLSPEPCRAAVEPVSGDGSTERGEVGADLVRASGARPERREREVRRGPEPPEAGLGLEPVARAGQPPAGPAGIAREAQGAGAAVGEPGHRDGEVLLPGDPGPEARRERRGRGRGLAEDHHPGGVSIQPVHQPGLAAEVRRGEEQQAGDAPGSGLRGQPCRLVHGEHLVVLVEHAERRDRGQRGRGAPSALLEHHQHLRAGRDGERRVPLPAATEVDRAAAHEGARLLHRAAEPAGHHLGERARLGGAEGTSLHARRAPSLTLTGEFTSWQRRPP